MTEPASLKRFEIIGLRKNIDIKANISDNTLILVGENGSGKTTFLRIMFYFLSGRWASLSQFDFAEIRAEIGSQLYVVKKEEISNLPLQWDENLASRLPPSVRRQLRSYISRDEHERATAYLQAMGPRYGLSRSLLNQSIHNSDLFSQGKSVNTQKLANIHTAVSRALNSQILYLPTFRRIERELSSILQGYDGENIRSKQVERVDVADDYVELVEFGMGDVKEAISAALQSIQQFAGVGSTRLALSNLGDVVNQTYRSATTDAISNISAETINMVVNRIDSSILDETTKQKLKDIVWKARNTSSVATEHEQIVYNYFAKLLKFQSEMQEKESNIKSFCDLCSSYISNKKFVYENNTFSFKIEFVNQEGEIDLSELSSGEKQIVSLFSHMYLSGRHKFFVLIDEPELSLSVPWQRRFLEDIRSGSFCSGLCAVTHSPFIYDNSLRRYTRALGEFVSGADWGHIQ